MIENIQGISIKGRCFPSEKDFDFFKKSDNSVKNKELAKSHKRIAIVYGKNGSGKTTISEGFKSLVSQNVTAEVVGKVRLQDPISDAPDLKNKVFVFNERFIDENVKFNKEGLDTIVLFGKQIDIDSQIDRLNTLLDSKRDELQKKLEERQPYTAGGNKDPKAELSSCSKIMREKWAGRYKDIKDGVINGRVTDQKIHQVMEEIPAKDILLLKEEYDNNFQLKQAIKERKPEYSKSIDIIKYNEANDDQIISLLGEVVEEPILTEREKFLLELSKNGRQNMLQDAKAYFSHPNVEMCPYCMQPVDENYKNDIVESIENVLSERVDIHKRKLSQIALPDLELVKILVKPYESLYPTLVLQINARIESCNNILKSYKVAIESKLSNIYTPYIYSDCQLSQEVEKANELLLELENNRLEIQNGLGKREELIRILESLNDQIAYFEIKDNYEKYETRNSELNSIDEQIKAINVQIASFERDIAELKTQKANTKIAVDNINRALAFVFVSEQRLVIEEVNGRYVIKSGGQNARPDTISLGERNVLALAYFFSLLNANVDIEQIYRDERLIVLDDPVSSFDFDNRIGVMSYLRGRLLAILKGNASSKVLFLTHDVSIFHDLKKISNDVLGQLGYKNGLINWIRLSNKDLVFFPDKANNYAQYEEMLGLIYKFAIGEADDLEVEIGNIVRRVVEAYSTFLFNAGLDFVRNEYVALCVGDKKEYYENLMMRLFLNNESHTQDLASSACDQMLFNGYASSDEKKRICKDVLCLIYLITPYQIKTKLPDVFDTIKSWVK